MCSTLYYCTGLPVIWISSLVLKVNQGNLKVLHLTSMGPGHVWKPSRPIEVFWFDHVLCPWVSPVHGACKRHSLSPSHQPAKALIRCCQLLTAPVCDQHTRLVQVRDIAVSAWLPFHCVLTSSQMHHQSTNHSIFQVLLCQTHIP